MSEPGVRAGAMLTGPRSRVIGGLVLAAVIVAGAWWWRSAGRESTDDAQVDGRITPIGVIVPGTVSDVPVEDHEFVEAGTVLVQIDPATYEVAVERARAELAEATAREQAARSGLPVSVQTTSSDRETAVAALSEARSGVVVAEQELDASKARLRLAEANVRDTAAERRRAEKDLARLNDLLSRDEIARQRYDHAVREAEGALAREEAATAAVAEAQARAAAAESRLAQAQSRATEAEAELRVADTGPERLEVERARAAAATAEVTRVQAEVRQAEIALASTTLRAPSNGVVSRRSVEVGQVVGRGHPTMALVSRDDVWVTANFKETQIERMRPGQSAVFSVDGLGGRRFQGHVDSISPATGAKFALIPPDNATGNFVKVVQRIPVKIAVEPGQDPDHELRPGMSVYVTIDLR